MFGHYFWLRVLPRRRVMAFLSASSLAGNFLLKEDGDKLLLETGSFIELE
jgi:hypothetical protein